MEMNRAEAEKQVKQALKAELYHLFRAVGLPVQTGYDTLVEMQAEIETICLKMGTPLKVKVIDDKGTIN